jgi:hypothetical protein
VLEQEWRPRFRYWVSGPHHQFRNCRSCLAIVVHLILHHDQISVKHYLFGILFNEEALVTIDGKEIVGALPSLFASEEQLSPSL